MLSQIEAIFVERSVDVYERTSTDVRIMRHENAIKTSTTQVECATDATDPKQRHYSMVNLSSLKMFNNQHASAVYLNYLKLLRRY
jgi:hypothetical protein